jgi:type II restriction enzyme
MTEEWANRSAYYPNYESELSRFENNAPVADFYCSHCLE